MSNIQLAIDYFGSQAALAKALGVNPMAVTQWKKRGLPPVRAMQISKCTHGAIKPDELLPDFFNLSFQESIADVRLDRRATDKRRLTDQH
jgi:DNA-binding transcriptional regulator YdaS (Cro superfamily)